MNDLAPYDAGLKPRSQELRRSTTKAETFLWIFLRGKKLDGCRWYRQKPLENSIVDFYCPKRKLIVEADGAHHFTKDGREYDAERDAELKELGLKILRFSNNDILKKTNKVLKIIAKA
jgi:very-short-patch-repair endonuclease